MKKLSGSLKIFLSISLLNGYLFCSSIPEILKQKGYKKESISAFLHLLRRTGSLSPEIIKRKSAEESPKQESLRNLAEKLNLEKLQEKLQSTNDIEEVLSQLSFESDSHVEAFLVAATQVLWFRSNWEKETASSSLALNRWSQLKEQTEETTNIYDFLQELELIDEIKRPNDFQPDIIIWLGAIEHSAKPRIYGDIPADYAGPIVVHSNRRGLFINQNVIEQTAVDNIAEQLNLAENTRVKEIIIETCKAYKFYNVSENTLQESTKELRELIIQKLRDNNLLSETNIDFNWPTHRELYKNIFFKAQQAGLVKSATLEFDDPAPLSNNRIHTTESEAQSWLEKIKAEHPEKFAHGKKLKVLALSVQPFVKFQEEALKSVLDQDCELVVVGPKAEKTPNTRKDALESLAKILFMQAKNNPEIKALLPWI